MEDIRPALMTRLYAAGRICIDTLPHPINRGSKSLLRIHIFHLLLCCQIVTRNHNKSDCGRKHLWLNHIKNHCVHHFLGFLLRLIHSTWLFTVLTNFYRQHFGIRRRFSTQVSRKIFTCNYQFITTIWNGKKNQVSCSTLWPATTFHRSRPRARRPTRSDQPQCWRGSWASS